MVVAAVVSSRELHFLSNHLKTTGFDPFKLPTRGLLQKGWDHFPPKAFLEESSAWFDLEYLGILSYILCTWC